MTDSAPQPREAIPQCPICGGSMQLVYDRPNLKVCVCVDCHTGINVPTGAWQVARQKGVSVPPSR